MIWVAAQAIAALVVDLFFAWHVAIEVYEHGDVGRDCLSVQAHATIPTPSTVTTGRTCPVPAASIFVDLHTFHDLIEYGLASICDGRKFHGFISDFKFAARRASCRTKGEHPTTYEISLKSGGF